MSSLLIVDDYEPTRRGIRALLRGRPDWQICGEATDGVDAVEMAKLLRPDCILMDVTMPRLNGLEATRLILEHAPRTRVVIVTQNDASVARLQAEGVGACGFVAKSELDDELIPAIEAALASLDSSPRAEAAFPVVPPVRKADVAGFLSGRGEMGELIRSMDWAETAIGPIESWPPTLRMMVSFLLANRFPALLWWGPEYCQLYNDAYRPVLGTKHPCSMGQRGRDCWTEIWHILGPLVDTPFRGGPATWMEDLPLELNRYGFLEETHFTVAYSAVPDETAPGGIGGVLATIHEITEKVVGQRRLAVLRDVSARTSEAKTAEAACALAAQALGRHPEDAPFGLFYLIDADRKRASLAAACGVEIGTSVSPRVIGLKEEDGGPMWPLGKVARTCELELLEGLGEQLQNVLPGPWADPPHSAVVIPVHSNIAHQLAGFLVAGVSVRLRFDDVYRSFFELLGTQVATVIAAARAHEEERKRTDALAEIDRAKTVFFSNISHEFRTPLTLMLGPLEDTLAGSNGRLLPEHREDLTTVYRNSLRLLKLVNSLLDFSRIEAGRIEAIYQPTDICAFTSEIASAFRSAMERAGLRYEVTAEDIAEPIYLDRDMWEKIVLNLLSNAFKFTLKGQVSLSIRLSGSSAQIEVRDTGIGIAEKDLPRLFERFHRLEGAQGRTYEGTGIGLALVQELVKLHGGSMSVRSIVGSGTTFTVSIPRGKDHIPRDRIEATRTLASSAIRADSYIEEALRWLPEPAEQAGLAVVEKDLDGALVSGEARPKALQIDAERPLILVADDNSDMLAYLSKLLKAEYRVRVASNGLQALRAVRDLNPDLILTDIMMPELDGLGLLQAIRNDPATAGKPVILLSARAGEEARIDGLQAGADDYIIKPFSARELLARVSAALALAKVRREAADRLEEQVRMRTQELEHRNAEVLEQTGQLRELSARLLHAQDDERRRIARELHDSAGQTLAALSWNLSHIVKATQKDPEAAQAAMDSKSLVNDLTQEIRTISYLLHPPLLDESGLSSALRWYVDGLNQRSDIVVDLELSKGLARLSPELELAIFRIIQECLTNIHRHSESKTAKIRIEQNSEMLLVEVKDQGKGIAADALTRIQSAGSGVGIRGMSERIRHFGGVLDIKSNRGGTKVMVKFPVSKSAAARAS